MPSFTSNSDNHPWLPSVILMLALWAAGFTVFEAMLRLAGHRPTIVDSPQLWAQERGRVYGDNALVFLGASRTLYGIDLETVSRSVPGKTPVMLAMNGRYPLATLRALSEDMKFTGTVLVDTDARGLAQYNWEAQAPHNEYFADEWSPSWAVHRWLVNLLQGRLVILNPRLGVLPLTKTWLTDAPPPFVGHDTLSSRREGFLDFAATNPAGLAEMFRADLSGELERQPPPPEEEWLENLAVVQQWVTQIEARGGKVIFFVPPVAGAQRALAETAYPQARYWQRFIDHYGLAGWHFSTSERGAQIELPDQSHVDQRHKVLFTQLLIEGLREAKLL